MEVLNDLVGYRNLKIFQNTDWFVFSLDSVLLPNFVTLRSNINKILDLGCGNAPIPFILSTKTEAEIIGVEIQKDSFDLAQKGVVYNQLQNKVKILNIDMRDLNKYYNYNTFDVITCNPPYFKYLESSNLNEDEHKIIARHEKMITLEEIVDIAHKFLKTNGIFAIIHRTDRLIEAVNLFNKYGLEIKKLRFIYPKIGCESNMILIEGRKNGKVGLKVLPPLYVHNGDGSYTSEVLKMFE